MRPGSEPPLPPMPGAAGDAGRARLERSRECRAGRNADPFASLSTERLSASEELEPMALSGEEAKKEGSGAKTFFRALFLGDEHEQKPDQSLMQGVRGIFARSREKRDAASQSGGGQAGGPASAPGLFAAMDAPLHGLTPDDIRFAGEVDAALARRPRFGVRALSVCVALMFAFLLIWAAFAKIDEVTHAEGSVVGFPTHADHSKP